MATPVLRMKQVLAPPPLPAGAGSWLLHWQDQSRQRPGLCSVKACSLPAELGGVLVDEAEAAGEPVVAPLCARHAGATPFALELSRKTLLIPCVLPPPPPPPPLPPPEAEPDEPVVPGSAGELALPWNPLPPSLSCEALHEQMLKGKLGQCAAVVEDGRPLGLVHRAGVIEEFSRLYFREVFGKKPITRLMSSDPLVVDHRLPIDELGRLVATDGSRALEQGFIVTRRGRYMGLGTGQALLRAMNERREALLAQALERAMAELKAAQAGLLEQERLSRELELARGIQAGLLPRALPSVPGYEFAVHYSPANEVGGDYYDLIPLGDGSLGLAVADVAGKGVPASLGMAILRAVLRAEAAFGGSPGRTLARTDGVIGADLPEGMFISALYAVLDPQRHALCCASAGHTPALWLRQDGCVPIEPEGMALGVARGRALALGESTVTLAPGDSLLMYTDGLSEAMDPDGQEYGEARLRAGLEAGRGLSLARQLEALVASVQDFRAGAPASDDLTLLMLRRSPEA